MVTTVNDKKNRIFLQNNMMTWGIVALAVIAVFLIANGFSAYRQKSRAIPTDVVAPVGASGGSHSIFDLLIPRAQAAVPGTMVNQAPSSMTNIPAGTTGNAGYAQPNSAQTGTQGTFNVLPNSSSTSPYAGQLPNGVYQQSLNTNGVPMNSGANAVGSVNSNGAPLLINNQPAYPGSLNNNGVPINNGGLIDSNGNRVPSAAEIDRGTTNR